MGVCILQLLKCHLSTYLAVLDQHGTTSKGMNTLWWEEKPRAALLVPSNCPLIYSPLPHVTTQLAGRR